MIWKGNAPYVLCLTHDVDRIKKQWYHYCYYGLKHPIVQCRSLFRKIQGNEPYWNFNALVSLEEKYAAKSTFLFLNETRKELSANFLGRYKLKGKKVIAIIKELDKKGFDIGLHGSFYSFNDLALLEKEKNDLEEIVGHQIYSTRQHHLNFDKDNTWRIQQSIGLKYDSTEGYSNQINLSQPFRTPQGIIEIPMTLMDTMCLDDKAFSQCDIIAQNHGVIMINFHQCHFNELEYHQNVEMYKKLLAKANEEHAWITNMKELGEWLDERIP